MKEEKGRERKRGGISTKKEEKEQYKSWNIVYIASLQLLPPLLDKHGRSCPPPVAAYTALQPYTVRFTSNPTLEYQTIRTRTETKFRHSRSSHTKTSSEDHLHHRLALFTSQSRSSPSTSEAAVEREYDRLRTLSQSEHDQCHSCFQRSSSAYHRGDHAAAHELSERGKEHGRQADIYARQASEYIFEQLNRPGQIDEDTIDLHGQYVSEAEEIMERELKEARRRGRKGLTVYVFYFIFLSFS